MARRHLGLSAKDWDTLDWWEQRLYIEGLVDEGLVSDGEDADPTLTNEEVHGDGQGTTVTERNYHSTLNGEAGEFSDFGFTEQSLGG